MHLRLELRSSEVVIFSTDAYDTAATIATIAAYILLLNIKTCWGEIRSSSGSRAISHDALLLPLR